MKNKKLIYLAILFISLLAISSVSASEIDDDIVLNEEIVDDIDTELVSSVDTQSVDDSEENILNENSDISTELQSVDDSEENILNENSDGSDKLGYLYDDFVVNFYDVDYRSDAIISIDVGEHENGETLKIYVDRESSPRWTYKLRSSVSDTLYIYPNDLNLNFGTHFLEVKFDSYEYGEVTLSLHNGFNYNCLKMYVYEGKTIFEDVDVEVSLWDIDNDEGTLTYSINNKTIATKNCIKGYNDFTIPYSYLDIGENVISVKYVGPNFPTDEISEIIKLYPKYYDLPRFISTSESANVIVEFTKNFIGTVNVYDSGYYHGEYFCNLTGSGKIIDGIANIKISNLSQGSHGLVVESITNRGEIDEIFEFWVIANNPRINVELTPTNILIGENSYFTLNAPSSGYLILTIDGKREQFSEITSYIKVLSNLGVGKHTVSVKFDGEEIDSYLDDDDLYYSNTFTITVNALKTSISASNVNAVYDTTKSISATLKDNLGNPISGKTLSLVINKKTYTAKTNANGKATFKVSAKLLPKAYTATIKFAGDKTYAQFTKSIKVTVKKATPKLTASAKTFKVKVKTKKYSITLKNNNGKVMKSTKVTLKVNGKTYSVKTNSKGVATFKITNLKKKGKFTAVVTYAGSKYYNKVTKKPKISIKA